LRKRTAEIQEDRVSYGGGTGLALMNVNHRINLVFGNDYGIHVYSTLNKGTDVEIVLPLIKDRERLVDFLEYPMEKTE
jgi:two-component system, sensor histidine kinase YesM